MVVVDEVLLAEFRQPGPCEWCGRPCPEGRDPAHIFSRGAGRIDIRGNVVALCRGFWLGKWISCHQDQHEGRITRADLLAVAAARDGTTQDAIETEVYRLRRLPREYRVEKRHRRKLGPWSRPRRER